MARWLGDHWDFKQVTPANHNYTTGSIAVDRDGAWRIVGPAEPGPQPVGPGGEVALWTSRDAGQTWLKTLEITRGSALNHNYVRRAMHAHPDFDAFWADGNPDEFSQSSLYFANRAGDKVWRLPYEMNKDFAEPLLL